jgi:thiol:disulfide interchange protein DsbC
MHTSNVSAAPAIFFDNGKRISGFATAETMNQTMAE